MNMRARIQRLEKLTGVGQGAGGPEEMTDMEILDELRAMFQADPARRWEDEIPGMGFMVLEVLDEVRAAAMATSAEGPT